MHTLGSHARLLGDVEGLLKHPSVSVELARPFAPVTTGDALIEPPPEVTVKLTEAPLTGLLYWSWTSATKAAARAVATVPDCASPLTITR